MFVSTLIMIFNDDIVWFQYIHCHTAGSMGELFRWHSQHLPISVGAVRHSSGATLRVVCCLLCKDQGWCCVCVCVCVCVRMRTYFRNMFYVFSCQAHNITPSPLLCSKHMLLDDFLNQIPTALMMFATPASFIMGHTSVDHGWICRPMFPCKYWLKKTFLFSSFM